MNGKNRAAVFLIALALLAASARSASIDDALNSAGQYLASRQDKDGAWRSGVHGSFRDGPSLTPHVLSVLYFLRDKNGPITAACDRSSAYLLSISNEDLNFPVYTAAEVCWALSLGPSSPQRQAAQRLWTDYLRQRQLNRHLNWNPDDIEFGGWGYAPSIPRKPPEGQLRGLLEESNLSATLFAAGALRIARTAKDDPLWQDVLVFVDRCQNFSTGDAKFDDGGFFFMPGDAARNKAGVAGTDTSGRERYHSYGSMTADGLRTMLVCGRAPDHPRVQAAKHWLENHFSATRNPGDYEPDREVLRDGTYYYYCWSIAHALTHLGATNIQWAAQLSQELLRRQHPDGSWASDASDGREDDPLVATPFAAAALAICREQLRQNH